MRTIYLTLFIFLFSFFGYGQKFQIPDSLQDKTIDELEKLMYKHYQDTIKREIYAYTLLAKAKQKNTPLALARGYRSVVFTYRNKFPERIAYLDSSIAASKDLNDRLYPAVPYSIKGGEYRVVGDFDKSLDCYIAALKYSKKANNMNFYYLTKHNIASLKKRIGEFEEAAVMFKEVINYEDKNNISGIGHLATILYLADSYRKLEYKDSATFYNKIGIKESLKDSIDIYDYFVLNEGINLFYKQQYQASLDSINKALIFFEDAKPRDEEILVIAYLHLAKLYKKFDNKEKCLDFLLKINQSYKRSNFACKEMRESYTMLIDYYKSKDNKDRQLHYINELLSVDSILDKRYKSLNKKITKDYDTPNLLRDKEEIIASLEAEKSSSATQILIISSLLVLSLGGVGYYYYNQRRYKKRFLQLLDTNTPQETTPIPPPKDNTGITTISPDTLEQLLAHFKQFEKNQKYLAPNINSKDLAKSFGSNSSYLSLVVNTYKQKTLSQYINDLRIDFVVEKLQSDSKFRKYTIKAIAQEVGFNTAEAFSKTFYKKTGIYPSYFIKKLEE
ncbi:helix-turn-helix domain-containing protein [Aquimarina sp. Aq78]|uniref:helix-turn-helix domain-containing protein n=1 Tax=Aquimarina sp. Aq78 TaxID=1191889 RepID=UPI000D0F293C|nr:helix-turn-helix domain-containing protein [Aquimarina sp. Aq78]